MGVQDLWILCVVVVPLRLVPVDRDVFAGDVGLFLFLGKGLISGQLGYRRQPSEKILAKFDGILVAKLVSVCQHVRPMLSRGAEL